MELTGALLRHLPEVSSSDWDAPPSVQECGSPLLCTCEETKAQSWPHQEGMTSFSSLLQASTQTWVWLAWRCSMPWAISADACSGVLGCGAAANIPYRIFGEAHSADDHLRPGRRPAWIRPLVRGDDCRCPRICHRRLDRGVGPPDGCVAIRCRRTRRKPPELHAGRLWHREGSMDRSGGVWPRDIGRDDTALLRSDGRGSRRCGSSGGSGSSNAG